MPDESRLRRLFEECVDHNADSMFRVAYRLTGRRDLADELVQESYMQAWKNIASLKNHEAMRGWLFAILRNQYSKIVRKTMKTTPLTDAHVDVIAVRADTESNANRDWVQRGLAQLDDDYKFPILLVSMEGLPVKTAAEILQIPTGTVLSRLHRGRKKLKAILNTHKINE